MIDYNVDIEMKLLNGSPIFINNIGNIFPLKLKEISDIGLTTYNQFVNLLCIESNMLKDDIEELSSFQCLLNFCNQSKEMLQLIGQSINIFVKKDVYIDTNINRIFIGENLVELLKENKMDEIGILSEENYEDFKFIIKLQNGLISNNEDEFNPKDEKARQIIEKMKKCRQKVSEQKMNDSHNQNINLVDLISILASNSDSLNIINVWDLTYYQFNDQFARMKILDDYNINIRYLLAGAKSEDVNLKHWLCKNK